MKKIKQLAILVLIGCFCMGLSFGFGCAGAGGGEETPTQAAPVLNVTELKLNLYETANLRLLLSGETLSAKWTAEGDCISVDNMGVVTANSVGSGTVKALYDGKEYVCNVSVSFEKGKMAGLELNHSEIEVTVDESYLLIAKILYDQEEKDLDCEIKAETDATEYVSVSVGSDNAISIKGLKATLNDVEVVISCIWKGCLLTKTVTVSVVDDLVMALSDTSAELFRFDYNDCVTEITLSCDVYKNKVKQSDALIAWSIADETIASVENGKVTAQNVGETIVTAKYEKDGKEYAAKCMITVSETVIKYDESLFVLALNGTTPTVVDFSALGVTFDSDLIVSDLADENYKALAKIKENGRFELENGEYNGLYGGENRNLKFSKQGFYSILINADVINKVIYNADDLLNFKKHATIGANNSYDGYFVLGSNIDMSGKEITASGIKASDKGFIGTFDGRGYSVTGGSYGRGGLFGIVSSQGVVKNIAVENIQMYSYATYDENNLYSSVIARTFRGTLEGIIIKVDGIVEKESGAWGCYALGFDIAGSTLKNVVIYENSNNGANAFVFCGSTSDKNTTFENVYFRPANGVASNKKYIAEGYYANNISGTVTQIISDTNCNDITDIDGEYWDLSGTKASFKHNVALNEEYKLFVAGEGDAQVANTAALEIPYAEFQNGSTVKIDGVDITDKVSYVSGKIIIEANAFTSIGEKLISINGVPKIKVRIITAELNTPYDILHFTDYATRGAENSYDGYFVLGSNIDMSGKEITASGIKASDKGFIGTFDGRGYSLTGGSYGRGGLFGIVSSQGVVKNIAVENIQMYSYATYDENNLYSSVFARTFRGTLEGIIIKVDGIVEKESGAWGCYALGFDIAGSILKNVVIYENSNNGGNAIAFCGSTSDKNTTFENVYFRPANGVASNKKYIAEEYYANNIGGTVTQIISDTNCNDITDIDGEYWDLSGAKAVFTRE